MLHHECGFNSVTQKPQSNDSLSAVEPNMDAAFGPCHSRLDSKCWISLINPKYKANCIFSDGLLSQSCSALVLGWDRINRICLVGMMYEEG